MIRLPKKKIILFLLCLVLLVYCLINYYNLIDSKHSFVENNHVHNGHDGHNHLDAHHNQNHHEDIIPDVPVPPKKSEIIITNIVNTSKKLPIIQNKRLLAYDAGGFGAVQSGITKCKDGLEFETTGDSSRLPDADISFYHMQVPPKGKFNKPHYSMVFTLESEPHSYGGESWDNADFRMWYNLDLSHPEPATYFDMQVHLADLMSPPTVEFEKKTNDAPIVWIVSNCNAFNGREKYMKKLMSSVTVDSYGGCLKNKFSHTADRMKGNIELFSHYKFVIAIENSNCQDYVTEKLVHAVGSGSIPIVAGKNGKPDYLKFIPKNSYINLYDYESPEKLAEHIKQISQNKTLYESYIPFKRHAYTKDQLNKMDLPDLIKLAKKIFNPDEKFLNELVNKEKSENKICKIVRYLANNDPERIKKQIEEKRIKRPSTGDACLSNGNLDLDFPQSLKNINNNQPKNDDRTVVNIDKKPEAIQESSNNSIIK